MFYHLSLDDKREVINRTCDEEKWMYKKIIAIVSFDHDFSARNF